MNKYQYYTIYYSMSSMKYLIVLVVVFLSGCGTLAPIATFFELGEAAQAVEEDKKQPTTIHTTVKKEDDKVVVTSSSPKHSKIVATPIIETPETSYKPKIDIEKGLNAVPLWLILVSIASGILLFINMLRHRNKNNKGACHDTDRSIDDGRWSSDGRSVQVHGSSAEEQASADGNDDEGSPAATRAQTGRPRVRIQVGRRRSE
jgi:hypothetical protein